MGGLHAGVGCFVFVCDFGGPVEVIGGGGVGAEGVDFEEAVVDG